MEEAFKIYVERLRDGHSEKIEETFSPDFMDIQEKDLALVDPIRVSGEAYIAEETLILHLNIETKVQIPCSICNQPAKVNMKINNLYHTEPLAEIKSGIFNFQETLRENILLEVPKFAECKEGNCPHREEIKQYLKEPRKEESTEDEGYHPFADFKWDK